MDPVMQFHSACPQSMGDIMKRKDSLYAKTKYMARVRERIKWKPLEGEIFERKDVVGRGTYGHVYRAISPAGVDIAVKQITLEKEKSGFPITAVREIKMLQTLKHKNVVRLLDVITSKGVRHLGSKKRHKNPKQPPTVVSYTDVKIYLIFEYMHHDLSGLINNPEIELSLGNVKFILQEISEALRFLHEECHLIHRDIKGSNVLVDNDGNVKLADFGLSRQYEKNKNTKYTNRVVTLWYRAPELLLGSFHYGLPVDNWSLGCILAEMLTGTPLFQGHVELAQMEQICKVCGSPTEENWPGFYNIVQESIRIDARKRNTQVLPNVQYPRQLEEEILRKKPEISKVFSDSGWELLDGLLTLNPERRWDAKACLDSEWLLEEPLPRKSPFHHCAPSHEFQIRQRNREKGNLEPGSRPLQGRGVKITHRDVVSSEKVNDRAPPPPALPRTLPRNLALQKAVSYSPRGGSKKEPEGAEPYDYRKAYSSSKHESGTSNSNGWISTNLADCIPKWDSNGHQICQNYLTKSCKAYKCPLSHPSSSEIAELIRLQKLKEETENSHRDSKYSYRGTNTVFASEEDKATKRSYDSEKKSGSSTTHKRKRSEDKSPRKRKRQSDDKDRYDRKSDGENVLNHKDTERDKPSERSSRYDDRERDRSSRYEYTSSSRRYDDDRDRRRDRDKSRKRRYSRDKKTSSRSEREEKKERSRRSRDRDRSSSSDSDSSSDSSSSRERDRSSGRERDRSNEKERERETKKSSKKEKERSSRYTRNTSKEKENNRSSNRDKDSKRSSDKERNRDRSRRDEKKSSKKRSPEERSRRKRDDDRFYG